MVGPFGALYFVKNPLDMTRYRCFSGVRLTDQGPQRKRKVASLRDYEGLSATQPPILYFLMALILMGAW
jgi:hypothetical protein